MDGTSGPDGTGVAYFALEPVLPSQMQGGQFPLSVNGIGLLLRRSGTDEQVVDTLIPFHPDSSALHAAIRVGMLRHSEEFLARLTLQDGAMVLFSGTKIIFLQQGPPGTNQLDSIGVSYDGPGRDIARLAIDPPDPILRLGDSLQLDVTATDSSGNSVPAFFVSWTVSDTAVARVNALGLLRAPSRRSGVTISAMSPNGSRATTRATFVPDPVGMRLVGSDTVVAPVGTRVPFAVRVVAADSLGVPGVLVRFGAVTAGGGVADTMVVTDSTGLAATQVLVGATLQDYGYEAGAASLAPGRLTVDAIAGPPASIKVASGNAQSGQVGAELVDPVVVRVRDALGNPVVGQRVNFVITSGGGSVWAGSNNTNDSGIAMERWTLGTSTAVLQQLQARAVDNTTGAPLLFAVFTATPLPGAADSLERLAGDGQAGVVGAALADSLAVRVRDRYGNPVPGVAIQWAAEQGSVTAGSAASNAEGVSRAAWVLGQTLGAQRATAAVASLAPTQFGATAAAGAPAAAAVEAGTAQTGVAGSALAESLAVRVTDAFGNPVSGATVTWTTGDGGTVTTSGPSGADGVARAMWQLGTVAGTQTAQAAVGNLTASFSATAEAGPAAQVTVSGSGTSLDALGSQLTLGAAVQDAFGNVISNPTITWSSSDVSVAEVNASGQVTARHDGAARITATVAGSVAGFLEITVAQAVASVSVTPEQTTLGAVGSSVQLDLTALDANGNPVSQPQVTWESSDAQVATVSAGGLVTAVGPGQVTITATVGGDVAQTVTLQVAVAVVPTVTAVHVTPATGSFAALGQTLALQGTPVDDQGNPVVGAALNWHSSDETVATVSAGVVTAVGNGSATITAFYGTVSGQAIMTVQQAAATVTVSPSLATLNAIGATISLTAAVADANNHPMSAAVTWTSSQPGTVSVDPATGLVTAVASGQVTVTASSGTASGTATVQVAQAISSVEVSPAAASLTGAGQQTTLTAVARDALNHEVAGATFAWTSGDPAIAMVDAASGVVTAVGNGTVSITATSGGKSGSATVNVSGVPTVVTIEVTPPSGTLTALGQEIALQGVALDGQGNPEVGEPLTWRSLNQSVATVSGGVVTAVGNGTAIIEASAQGVTGSAEITVAQVAAAVLVSPSPTTLNALGATVQLAAAVTDANDHPMSAAVTWTSSQPNTASVDLNSGLVTALGNGTVTITATSGGASGSAVVTVSQVAERVVVDPPTSTLNAIDATVALAAVVEDANGHAMDVAVTWASSQPGTASVNPSTGLVTALGNGTVTITATGGGRSGTASVTVLQVAHTVVVDPSTVSLSALGATQQLLAVVQDATAHVIDGAGVTWSSDGAAATVSGAGLVTAAANGTATITATSGAATGTASVTVAQVVSAVSVNPTTSTLEILGATVRLFAAVTDANDSAVAGAVVDWASSAPGVATVDGTGLVTAVANGTSTITASSGGKSATATVTVAIAAAPIEVLIDVGGGIQIASSGNTPVKILKTATFDPKDVNPTTVLFEGVAPKDNYSLTSTGDLQLHFTTRDLQLPTGTAVTVRLTGLTWDGRPILGEETITVISNSPAKPSPNK